MAKKSKSTSINQTAIGDGNVQIAGNNNTIRQEITNYIPIATEQTEPNQNESQDFVSTTLSLVNQTITGDNNTQVIGNNNLVQQIINFFRIDTEQQRALKNRRAMLELVKNIWIKGVLEKSLYNEVLIELGMEERPDAVDHPWDIQVQMPNQTSHTLPTGTSIINVFEEMHGAMLILGEPGSGKTTMLLELVRDCIDRAQRDNNQPVPVVFNLSSWDGEKSIDDWLEDELRPLCL
jgi:type IV secretory pathway ATPase VirB11/archaellum biosynthesis ATPase